jgi:hypothetical protein
MSNAFDTMRAAVAEARDVMTAADNMARRIAPLLQGRLRNVDTYDLIALKRELQDFDAHRKVWKPR